ncbi:MAG: hypothetical protein LAT77_09240 [Aliidiomarina sp.]|uniref:hypothetical protein n=1 Tax=Aliidiomarina sp. TaxID=1872439 RepID=UPI0025C4FF88|nr:hypothetical protein [Aliidiomarina sp.]MCH8502080.1 hypothetical protein [Aliidiomarina sp.]
MLLTGQFLLLMLAQASASSVASASPQHLPAVLVVREQFDASLVFGLEVRIWELQPPSVDFVRVVTAVSRHRPDCLHLTSGNSKRFDCMGQDYLLTYLDHDQEWFWAETQIIAEALNTHDLSWYENSEVRIDRDFFDLALDDLYRRVLDQLHEQEVDVLLHETFQGSFILSYDTQEERRSLIGWKISDRRSWLLTVRGTRL